MNFDEQERWKSWQIRKIEWKEMQCSCAQCAEKANTTAAPTASAEREPGVTASTGVKVWWLYPNRYMVLIQDTLYLTNTKGLKDWMRMRFGAWRIE